MGIVFVFPGLDFFFSASKKASFCFMEINTVKKLGHFTVIIPIVGKENNGTGRIIFAKTM
jgi:hypothetical protein